MTEHCSAQTINVQFTAKSLSAQHVSTVRREMLRIWPTKKHLLHQKYLFCHFTDY